MRARYRDIAAELQKEIRLGSTPVEPGQSWFLIEAIRRSDEFAAPLGWVEIYVLRRFSCVVVKSGSPALTMVRHYYGLREELFEVTVTTHPEGRYTYTIDMQRSLRPKI